MVRSARGEGKPGSARIIGYEDAGGFKVILYSYVFLSFLPPNLPVYHYRVSFPPKTVPSYDEIYLLVSPFSWWDSQVLVANIIVLFATLNPEPSFESSKGSRYLGNATPIAFSLACS